MTFLLDTHALIWTILDSSMLSSKVRNILEDTQNKVFVSSLSFWEIALKYSLGKLQLSNVLPDDLPALSIKAGFELIPVLPDVCASYYKLKADWHKDPFDRMLIWQAIQQNMTLITKDKTIANYHSAGLNVLW